MTRIYANEEMYRQSEKWSPVMDNGVLIIDDFYENPDEIYDMLENRPLPLWKYNPERNSPNGDEYFDCRVVDMNGHPSRIYYRDMQRILDICRRYWHKGDYNWNTHYEFNCFSSPNVFDKSMQHYPHIDSALDVPDNMATLNMLIYMDKEEDGGTAIYGGEWITNREEEGLLYPVEDRFKLERVIPAKYNRCVIFPGNQMHGAYIEDYSKYVEKFRYTQVIFFHPR